jgi:hypothetical protein
VSGNFLNFSRVDRASRTVHVSTDGLGPVILGTGAAGIMGRSESVGTASLGANEIAVKVADRSTWKMIESGVYKGLSIAWRGLVKAKLIVDLCFADRPANESEGIAMFAKQLRQPRQARGETYRLCDVMKGTRPAPHTQPSIAEFRKMSTVQKSAVQTDAMVFQLVDPALRSRVFAARMNATNGRNDPADDETRAAILQMESAGELDTSVAAALLRLMDAPDPASGFEARDVGLSEATEGLSDRPGDYYDPTKPAKAVWADLQRVVRGAGLR